MFERKEISTDKLFAAMVRLNDKNDGIDVYLVNNQDVEYSKVVVFTGGNMTIDEDLLETGKSYRKPKILHANSSLIIDYTDMYEIDDVLVWYHIDLYQKGSTVPIKLTFSLYKGISFIFKKPENLRLLNKEGYMIPLTLREQTGIPIKEEIKGMSLDPKYHKSIKD